MDNKIFTCDDCGKEFKYNSVYLKHINRKYPCKLGDLNDININEIKRRHTNLMQKINDKKKNSDTDKCYFCNNIYSTKGNLLNHVKNNCKSHKELLSELENFKKIIDDSKKIIKINKKKDVEIKVLKEENKKLKEENNKIVIADKNTNINDVKNINITNNNRIINNKITNNNNNLHIHLNSFGKEDLSHITDEDYKRYIRTIYIGLISFIKHVHCSDDNPANSNIYLENVDSKSVKIFENNQWLLKDSNEVITQLKDDKLNILDKKVEEFNDDHLKNKLEAYKTRLSDNEEATKILNNKIKDVLYNNNEKALL